MKMLIAGLGSIGRRHLRNLRALGQEDVVLYRTHKATLPDAELGDLPTFTELSLALEEKPDGVIMPTLPRCIWMSQTLLLRLARHC